MSLINPESSPEERPIKAIGLKKLQAICVTGHLANDWVPGAIWILAPAIGLALDLKPSEIGLLLMIHSVGASLAYFPAGVLADRVHAQGKLLMWTFWWVAIGYFVASWAPGFWSLAILLAIAGMGDAAWHPIATGMLVRQMPNQRGQALGIHALGGTLAEVLSPLMVGFLLSIMNWQQALQLSVLPTLLMGIAFLFVFRKIPARHAKTTLNRIDLIAFANQWRTRSGLFLIAGIASYNMALIALMTMTPLFIQRTYDFSSVEAGTTFAFAMLVGSIGQPVIGRLSDRRGRFWIFVFSSVLATVLTVSAIVFDTSLIVVGSLVGAMAILVMIRSGVLAMAIDHSSKHAATSMGFVFVVLDGVGALGAFLAGLAGDFNLLASFALAGGLSMAAVGLIAIARHA